MKSVLIKPDQPAELEAVLPIDRVIEVEDSGYCALADQQFFITEDQIAEVVNG